MDDNKLNIHRRGDRIVLELPVGSSIVLGSEMPIIRHPGAAHHNPSAGQTIIRTIQKTTTTTTETMTELLVDTKSVQTPPYGELLTPSK